jgi:hypothetical protein
MQQCEKLTNQLSGEEVPGRILVEEQAVRLLAGVVMLLRQHKMNKRGQCRACAAPDRIWRFWRRRSPCTVYSNLNFAMSQSMDVAWWQLFGSMGRPTSLDEVRKWMAERERAV